MRAHTPEWKFARRWTDEELSARLAALTVDIAGRPPASTVGAELTWHDPDAVAQPAHAGHLRRVASTGLLARERPGAPEPGGLFDRARDLLVEYELSDPAIVAAHFDRAAPLLGRPILLELKVLGLRYLCAVVVGAVLADASDHRTRFGFRVDTVAPHLERGSEWFLVTKDHADGTIRFSIRALWEPGQFPNRWTRLGFGLLARRYQRAWHRRAFRRLGDRLASGVVAMDAGVAATSPPWMALVRIGAVAGMRATLAPTLVSRALEAAGATGHGLGGRALASPAAGAILPALAALELVGDKLPMTPPRVELAPLVARGASGAWTASVIAAEQDRGRRARFAPALVGAASAIAAAFAGYRVRRWVGRRTGVPDAVLAVIEDAIALALGRRGLASAQRR